jgi:serpin B
MVLVNAIYFNGSWLYAFNTADTRNNTFYLPNGTTASVPFMNQQVTLRYYQDPAYTMLELPYGGGNSFDMYVVMPVNQQVSLRSFASSFSSTAWAAGLSKLDSQSISLFIPKWQASYSIEAVPELAALGMGIAFGPNADFSGMFSTPEQISQVIHKTYIDVTETGTVAAAATAVTTITAIRGGQPAIPVVTLNHPYLYFIVEKQTGAILFEGTMNNPASQN